MNMSPTYPTVTIFHGLFEEVESTKHRLDRGNAINVNLLRVLSVKVCRFPYCRAIAFQFLVSLRNCKKGCVLQFLENVLTRKITLEIVWKWSAQSVG